MTALIKFQQVSKQFDNHLVLQGLDLEIRTGEIFVLVGASGSGKTTTLKMINGLISQTAGSIYFAGKDIKNYDLQKLRWKIGYVLQQIALFPNMTVQQNIAVIPEMLGWSKKQIAEETERLLKLVNLEPEDYLGRYPRELSGGEQQRIGILRALIGKPEVILMDEPFSALDPLARTSLQDLVIQLHKELKTTIVFVTHDMKEALRIGTRIGIINQGILEQVGTPEELIYQPETDFVKSFFKEPAIAERITVKDLVDAGFYSSGAKKVHQPQIALSESITCLYSLLVKADQVAVVADDHYVGEISREQVFQFLSSSQLRGRTDESNRHS